MLWGYVITGVVGIAGTALGAWLTGRMQMNQVRLSVRAETERARIADKRRIYATCLAALDELSLAATSYRAKHKSSDLSAREAAQSRLHHALDSAVATVGEMWLIAPEEVADLADRFIVEVRRYNSATDSGLTYRQAEAEEMDRFRTRLYKVLRADLGEPVDNHLTSGEGEGKIISGA